MSQDTLVALEPFAPCLWEDKAILCWGHGEGGWALPDLSPLQNLGCAGGKASWSHLRLGRGTQ